MKKVLGQVNPAATTLTDFYTVPVGKSAVVSTLMVCNQGANATLRVSVAVGGAADNAKQYIYYDVVIESADTLAATVGLTLDAGDVVRAWASSTNLSFSLFGSET